MPTDLMPDFNWNPLKLHAAALLAQGLTHEQVSEQVGIARVTVTGWLSSHDFRAKVKQLQEEITQEITSYTTEKMKRLQVKAVDRLDGLLDSQSESIQLNAVKEVLERGPLRIQKGLNLDKIAPGTVILGERMLIAMQQVSEMTGDDEMLTTLTPLLDIPTPSGENEESTETTHDAQ